MATANVCPGLVLASRSLIQNKPKWVTFCAGVAALNHSKHLFTQYSCFTNSTLCPRAPQSYMGHYTAAPFLVYGHPLAEGLPTGIQRLTSETHFRA